MYEPWDRVVLAHHNIVSVPENWGLQQNHRLLLRASFLNQIHTVKLVITTKDHLHKSSYLCNLYCTIWPCCWTVIRSCGCTDTTILGYLLENIKQFFCENPYNNVMLQQGYHSFFMMALITPGDHFRLPLKTKKIIYLWVLVLESLVLPNQSLQSHHLILNGAYPFCLLQYWHCLLYCLFWIAEWTGLVSCLLRNFFSFLQNIQNIIDENV